MNWNFHKIKAQQLIKRIKYFKEIGLSFFFFFLILEWVLKERTNNRSANLSIKWVGQWSMVGYAHKKYKDNIFLMRQNWIHQKESKNCTSISGQLTALDSHGLGSSSEWTLLGQVNLWMDNLKAQYMQWSITATIFSFFSFLLIFFFFCEIQ